MSRLKLGELLVQKGKVNEEQVKAALTHQKRWGKKIGECLVDLKFISEVELCDALSKALRIPVVDISKIDPSSITKETLDYIPLQTARSHRLVPIAVREIRFKRRLVIATSDPTNYKIFDELQFKTSLPLLVMISPNSDIEWFIRRYYLGETESLPGNFLTGKETGETFQFIETISSIFDDAEFTNATKQHRKKTEDD